MGDLALMVRLEVKEIGDHFYASSDDVPGLYVGGMTREQACESAVTAMRALFKHNKGYDVTIHPARRAAETENAEAVCEDFVALAA